MENASKALLMAGGVLIGILILSLAAYLFVDFGSTSAEIHRQNEEKQITEFNSKFTSYEGYYTVAEQGNKIWQITIYDIITLVGYAKENNKYYEEVNDEKIDVKIGSHSALNDSDIDLINNYGYADDQGTLKKYMCYNIGYNSRGKVNSITFQ